MSKTVQDSQTGPRLAFSNSGAGTARMNSRRGNDLADLVISSSHRARALDEPVDLLFDWLPGFEKVIASTANGCAVMSEVGIYQKPMSVGDDLTFDNEGIAIRLLPAAVETMVAMEADKPNRVPPTLQLFDASGATTHTCYIASISDQLAFDVLMYGTRERELTQCLPSPVLSFLTEALCPVGSLPSKSFSDLDTSANLDACLLNGGISRRERLKTLAEDQAWQIDRQVILHWLRYLSDVRHPLALGVSNSTCLQLKRGRIDSITRHGELIELIVGGCRTFFDPAAISEYWVVGSKHSLSLECYTKMGTCALTFTQDRAADSQFNRSWMEILTSLPRAGGKQPKQVDDNCTDSIFD
ncbi:MAG: ChuX/HutX family heme-like substrate-binding protein [Pseudomonadota bacterium]